MATYIELKDGTLVDTREFADCEVDVIFKEQVFSGIHVAPGEVHEMKYSNYRLRFRG